MLKLWQRRVLRQLYVGLFGSLMLLAATSAASAAPPAQTEAVETVLISGTISNGTRPNAIMAGVTVTLQTYTVFEKTAEQTTTTDASGEYQFELANAAATDAFLVTVEHEGVTFNSDIGQASAGLLSLSVTLYDATSNPNQLAIDQLRTTLWADETTVYVTEIYHFNHETDAVFVGGNGNPADGTVSVAVPDAASNVRFERGFGGTDHFVPAPEVRNTSSGWVDTVVVRPGRNSHVLAVHYELPQAEVTAWQHTLPYPVNQVTLTMQIPGLVPVDTQAWRAGGDDFYTHAGVRAGEPLAFAVEATRPVALLGDLGETTSQQLARREFGLAAALFSLVTASVSFLFWLWQRRNRPVAPNPPQATVPRPTNHATNDQREQLLDRLARLDDRHALGEVGGPGYLRQRNRLLEELAAVWRPAEQA